MKKIPRYQWLPAVLFIYLLVMTVMFAPEMIRNGETTRLIVVSIIELLLIILLRFLLKKKADNDRRP